MAKLPDKDESDRPTKSGTKPVKKSTKPSKEKMALGATASSTKVSPKDRKPKLATGSEKSAKESVASDPAVKSPKVCCNILCMSVVKYNVNNIPNM